jgi:hypothetical protein
MDCFGALVMTVLLMAGTSPAMTVFDGAHAQASKPDIVW